MAAMIKHVIIWKVKEGTGGKTKEDNIREVIELLKGLKESVPGVINLEVGRNISESPSAQDIFFYTEFKDSEALDTYRHHPEHLNVVEKMKPLIDSAWVVDYEI
jgi:quinol monooxygenase YgiN